MPSQRTFTTVALALVPFGAALQGASPSGAAAAFLATWRTIPSYTCGVRVHETKGSAVQDRTFRYAYLKPHYARIDVTGGAGRGSGAIWTGGDTVVGHPGGMLSGMRATISIHDGRVVDLRGGTIDQGSFQGIADEIADAASLTSGDATVDGAAVDTVSFPYTDANGATKRTVFLSRTSHLPVREVTYAGDAVVEDAYFTNVDPAADLKASDF